MNPFLLVVPALIYLVVLCFVPDIIMLAFSVFEYREGVIYPGFTLAHYAAFLTDSFYLAGNVIYLDPMGPGSPVKVDPADLKQPGFDKIDFSKLKTSFGGGMATQKSVAEKWLAVTGCALSEGYGLSETSPSATCNPVDSTAYSGNIGLPMPNTELKLLDDDGNEVPMGTPGEIAIKGPQVMAGYWNNPQATAEAFAGGWFHSGDLVRQDQHPERHQPDARIEDDEHAVVTERASLQDPHRAKAADLRAGVVPGAVGRDPHPIAVAVLRLPDREGAVPLVQRDADDGHIDMLGAEGLAIRAPGDPDRESAGLPGREVAPATVRISRRLAVADLRGAAG